MMGEKCEISSLQVNSWVVARNVFNKWKLMILELNNCVQSSCALLGKLSASLSSSIRCIPISGSQQ